MQEHNWHEHSSKYKSLVDTGREPLPLSKHPKGLDFSKTIGNTTYTVKSHFNRDASESLLGIVLRWMDDGTDIS